MPDIIYLLLKRMSILRDRRTQEIMSVTLKDIAKAAKVDPAAVSRALNNDPESRRRNEACKRVKKITQEMGYRKNFPAASVRKDFYRTIAVICDFEKSGGLYTVRQFAGIQEKCVEKKNSLSGKSVFLMRILI